MAASRYNINVHNDTRDPPPSTAGALRQQYIYTRNVNGELGHGGSSKSLLVLAYYTDSNAAQVRPGTTARALPESVAEVPPVTSARSLPVTADEVPLVTSARALPVTAAEVTATRAPPVTAAQHLPAIAMLADLENDTEMWNIYLDEVKEDDSRNTEAWKDDANSIVTFVSHNLLDPCAHLVDKLQDRSFLRNCWHIHHRILQKLIPQYWQSDGGSSSADFIPTSKFPE